MEAYILPAMAVQEPYLAELTMLSIESAGRYSGGAVDIRLVVRENFDMAFHCTVHYASLEAPLSSD